MICTYGFSLRGTSHISADIVCQDAHRIKQLRNGWIVAAIADGVGSSKYSDIAAKIAVDTVIYVIETGLISTEITDPYVDYIMRLGFITALHNITCAANMRNDVMKNYDTTLTAIIYDGKRIVYGHVGDGGIIGLTVSGEYIPVTKVQKGDEYNMVIPLRAGLSYWVFGTSDEKFASLLLFTDGLLDIAMPSLLSGGVYVRFVKQFIENSPNKVKAFLLSDSCKPITDDKTIVTVINNEITADIRDAGYYAEPDWKKLREEKHKLLYNN